MLDQPGVLRFGVFEVHLAVGELRKNGSRVKLQEQPFQVLVTLLKRPGEIVTREELKEKLWAGDTFVDFDHSLSTAVNKIREVLGDSATSPRFIETVPRKGYRFVGGTAMAQGDAVEIPAATPIAAIGSRRWWAWGFAGIAFIALAAFGISKWQDQSPQTNSVAAGPVPFTSLQGSEERPAFSPDGTRVAFSWSGETGDNVDIYVQVVGSTDLLRLTDDPARDENPSWSPDGRQIAFTRTSHTEKAIYLTSPVGGPGRRVTELSDPSLGIERSSALLTRNLVWGSPTWTSDGKSILFSDRESSGAPQAIYRFFFETGEKRLVTFPHNDVGNRNLGDALPAVSPDGLTLAFVRGTPDTREVYLVPTEGGEPRKLTSHGQVTVGLTWTGDGRGIVYAKTPAMSVVIGGLWWISATGGDPRPLPGAGQGVRYPAISPQGKRLVYERVNVEPNIWLYPLPGEGINSPPRKVIASTQTDGSPRISPDGNRIVFASNRTGRFEIWVADRDGSNLIQLASLDGLMGSPRWSPDGSRIAFDSNLRGNWDIFEVDIQGGTPRPLTTEEGDDIRPSWSHDGRWIYFASDRSGTLQIWKASSDGGQTIQLTQGGGVQAFESPDGFSLYFTRGRGATGIWVVPVEGGKEIALPGAAEANFQEWDAAKNGIYFVEQKERSTSGSKWFLRLLPLGEAEPVDITEVPAPWGASPLDIAPDGKWFVYAQVDRIESDLMLIENFE